MIDVTPAPSTLLKILTTGARWLLVLLLLVWFALGATWGALHWLIVPRIGEFRPYLEARATQLLGVPVRVGAISAYSNGVIPSLELIDVQLFDAQGREALRLPRILAALSPRSVWRWRFEQLYIDRPQLSIRRGLDRKIVIAGFDFFQNGNAGPDAADWFFSQPEFVIHQGRIEWTDELRAVPTLALEQVDLVVRNKSRRQEMRLDATPPALWGERLSVKARFRQPLLSRHNGDWRNWQGQIYTAFDQVNLSELRRYADVGVEVAQGRGAVRAWLDVSQGQLRGGVADVALSDVRVTLGADLQALKLASVQGRLAGRLRAADFELSTQALQFDTRDGLHWPGGNVSVSYVGAAGKVGAHGELKADKLDLAALLHIADRLPLAPSVRSALLAYAPRGLVQHVQASWQGPIQVLTQYQVKGLVTNLELAAQPALAPASTLPAAAFNPGWPGVRGLNVDFDFNQSSGKAALSLNNGTIELPGVFEEPVLVLTQLSADAKWRLQGEHLAVELPNLKFSNADAQGTAQVKWESSDPAKSSGRARLPGLLDLQGSLTRADATRVYRYLPLVLDREVRQYLREAVLGGTASAVKFKVKGDLFNLPFTDSRQGEFRIAADIRNATFKYVPLSLQPAQALPWPVLTQLNGELLIDRTRLQVKDARARLGATSGLQVHKLEALIPDLNQAVVQVNAQARGVLSEMLGLVNGSPLGAMTGHALLKTVTTGSADYALKLSLPIALIDTSLVQGSVVLSGNEVQISPTSPKLSRARGVVGFSENGFSITGGQARMLGGEVNLEGGSTALSGPQIKPIVIRASGVASAEGLRQSKELSFVARLAQHASGSAAYSAVLGFHQGEPELLVQSNLQGLTLHLPTPLNKSADVLLPLRFKTAVLREPLRPGAANAAALQDQLTLELGRLASLVYFRDISGSEPRVLRGSLAVGLLPQESAPLPDEGVVANLNLNVLNLDAWGSVLSQAAGAPKLPITQASASAWTYLPTRLALRAGELTLGGRTLHQMVLGGTREGRLWRANLDARELNGYLEYRQPSDAEAGRVHARLARLSIAPSVASEVEALLSEQPASIPELDIVVEDFELRGKRLGRLEVDAVNRGVPVGEGGVREWRLNKFNLTTPEAALTSSGNWVGLNAGSAERRRTVLSFKLEMADAGALLARLGMKEVIRKGRGKMEGHMAWLGSPLSLDYPSMSGAFTVNVDTGQFLKAEPGIAKLLGVLSLQSLPRRLTLDFRDVFSEGFAFDFFRGDVVIERGIATTHNLQMKGVNAAVLMEGRADIARETQDLKVVVVPEINAGTASLIASVINPAVGVGTFLAQLFLQRPLSEAATQEFHIGGAWADPKITRVTRVPRVAGRQPPEISVDTSTEALR